MLVRHCLRLCGEDFIFNATSGYPVARVAVRVCIVRRLLNILVCLLVFSFGTTATAHVLERPDISVSSSDDTRVADVIVGHVPGDADQVPSDGDKGFPHHHGGCHGDHVAAPVKIANTALKLVLRLAPIFSIDLLRPLSTADPALRPPRA